MKKGCGCIHGFPPGYSDVRFSLDRFPLRGEPRAIREPWKNPNEARLAPTQLFAAGEAQGLQPTVKKIR